MRVAHLLEEGFCFKIGKGAVSFWYDSWLPGDPLCRRVPHVHISDSTLNVRDVWRDGVWNLNELVT